MLLSDLSIQGVKDVLKPYGITLPEFDLLAVLRRCGPPFRRSAGELCAHTLLSSGAMTNRIDRLEQKGLVLRERNPEDRRGVLVALTGDGHELADVLVAERLREAHDRVSVLSPKDRIQLEALLTRFLQALQAQDNRASPQTGDSNE
jgi:DNA-binding MarR family transcriptional regulator